MSFSLDTNCLLRWLLDDDPVQSVLISTLIDSSETFSIADVAIIEMVFVLEKVKKVTRPTIHEAVLAIIAQGNLYCSREVFTETMALYDAHPKLSVVDCYLSVMARRNSQSLLTFDEKLATQTPGTKLITADSMNTGSHFV